MRPGPPRPRARARRADRAGPDPARPVGRGAAPRAARTTASSASSSPTATASSLAGLGQAAALEARGPGRFREVAVRARDLGRRAFVDDPARDADRPAAAGPVFVGGFAFAHDGGSAPEWSSLAAGVAGAAGGLAGPPARRGAHDASACWRRATRRPRRCVERALARLAELEPATMPLVDPDPAAAHRAWPAPRRPRTTSRRWQRAVERIRAGELEKVVLAREVRAHARRARTTRARCSARCARRFPAASAGASAPRSSPSSAPARSCSCAATGRARRPSRWPAPPGAAPTRRWTTTSASSCCAAPRTARSRRSSRGASSARSSRSASG